MKSALSASVVCLMLTASSAFAQSFLDQLEQRLNGVLPQAAAPARTPDAATGYLGLFADETADQSGIRVNELVVGGPASKAGIRAGDTILAIDGKPVNRIADMVSALAGKPAGTSVRFQVSRSGTASEHTVELGERKSTQAPPQTTDAPQAIPVPPVPDDRSSTRRASLGVTVTDVTDADITRYGLRSRRGAIVRSVRDGSPAKRFGISVGALIIAANGRGISSANDLVTVVSTLTPDDSIDLSYYIRNQLYTKTIPLSVAPMVSEPPPVPADAPLRVTPPDTSPSGVERPILRGLERALNDIVGPRADTTALQDENAALRRTVEQLRIEMEAMQKRMAALEEQVSELAEGDGPPGN